MIDTYMIINSKYHIQYVSSIQRPDYLAAGLCFCFLFSLLLWSCCVKNEL